MPLGNIKKFVKSGVIWLAGNPLFQNISHFVHKNKIIFLAYHGISKDSEKLEAWTLVRERQFIKQMSFLRNNFDCLTIEEALNSNLKNRKRPGAVVTFDDGYANNLEIALPVLDKLKIPAVIYITTKPVLERKLFWPDKIWMAAKASQLISIDLQTVDNHLGNYNLSGEGSVWQEQILELLEDIKTTDPTQREKIVEEIINKFSRLPEDKNLHLEAEDNAFTPLNQKQLATLATHPLITIGSHSHCHNLLDQIALREAKDSMIKSKKILEELTSLPIKHFAYPNGNYNTDLATAARELNFISAVTFQPGFFKRGDSTFSINRFGVGANVSIGLFKAMLTGVFELQRVFTK